ncbi:MAG: hypothetical protein R2783_08975 [Gelidibacter sp.]
MKKIKILAFIMLGLLTITSCIDDDNDELTGNQNEGGLVSLNNAAIGYVVGNDATYTASGSIYQGPVQTTSVSVFKSFTSSASGSTSNKVLLTTIPVSDTEVGTTAPFQFSFTYEDLIAGLTLDGASLPTSDSELNIGDFWTLSYVATTSTGQDHLNRNTTKVSVGTRFAGLYRTLDALYYRIGVLTATTSSWPAETLIESVDASTYRVVEYFGYFNGNEFYFQIDQDDKISYPDNTPSGDPQTGNGQPMITCENSPSNMTNVPCGSNTNYVQRDDVNGADKLYMSFGYLTAGSGPREFYQVLEKIVE